MSNKGFTLIELLVVVSILAAISGIGVSAVGGYLQKARQDLVHTEMKRIAGAVLKFNADTGYFPGEGVFAAPGDTLADKSDFSFLFYSPREDGPDAKTVGNEILPWNMDAERGWNGPYLDPDAIDYMRTDSGDGRDHEKDIRVFPLNAARRGKANGIIGLEDPFKSFIKSGKPSGPRFVSRTDKEDNLWEARPYAGKPYLYETAFKNNRYPECAETGTGCIALLSAGKNGEYENGSNDDIVRILRIN